VILKSMPLRYFFMMILCTAVSGLQVHAAEDNSSSSQVASSTTYSLRGVMQLKLADDKLKGVLKTTPAKDMIGEDFRIGIADLDDDGKPEAVIQSRATSSCTPSACKTIAIKKQGDVWIKVFDQNIEQADFIGVTNEKSSGYRLLATVDARNKIKLFDVPGAPSNLKPMVYAVASTASTTAETSVRSATVSAETKIDTQTSNGRPVLTLKSNDVFGISLGMNIDEVKSALAERLPSSSNFPINFDAYGSKWIGLYVSLPAAVTKSDNNFNKKADEVVIVDFAYPPSKQEVLAVTKFKSYPKDKTPSLMATEKSLIDKYGPWSKVTENRGSNYYYWGLDQKSGNSCVPVQLADPMYRLSDLVRAEGSQAVICQAYGKWSQCIKPVRTYFTANMPLKGCGVQAAASVRFIAKESKDVSPVSEIETFIVDLNKMADNEAAFADLASRQEKNKNLESIKSGGAPKL
jgi:hypothetical protein